MAGKDKEPNIQDLLEDLRQRKDYFKSGGGEQRIEKQKSVGKLSARERIEKLLDQGSFMEFGALVKQQPNEITKDTEQVEAEAVVCGMGLIDGRTVCVFAQDFTVLGGSLSLAAGQKIARLMDHAGSVGAPIIGINDSGGARIQDGVDSLAGYGHIFSRNVKLSGVVPQITIIVGPAAGGAVYSPAMNDFIFMTKGIGQMYITGPEVIKSVIGEQVSHEELGGTEMHAKTSGVAHFSSESEDACYMQVRRLLSFLPSNNLDRAPAMDAPDETHVGEEELRNIVPTNSTVPYDVMDVIRNIVDLNDFLPVQDEFAPNIVVGFGRMDGKTVGFVANQANYLAGMLDVNASVKAARFVRFCDAFNIPIVTLVDVPGFMPGVEQEKNGIIRHGAKLIYAYSEATVPKITVVLRKAYGGAYIVMNSRELGADLNLAWPMAEIAVMGPEAAVNIIHRSQLAVEADQEAAHKKLVDEYRARFANPYFAANRGYIDDVIDPTDTRKALIQGLSSLANKSDYSGPKKKHGNVPL